MSQTNRECSLRLLLYGINYAPELTGVGKYTSELATWLAAQGHDIRVVTAPPYYPNWRVQPGYSAGRYVRSTQANVDVWRCPVWVPAQPSGTKRLLHLASFAVSSSLAMLRQISWRPDAVWVVEPPVFCAPMAWVIAKLTGAASWLHVQDFELDAGFRLGVVRGQKRQKVVFAMERWLMRRFDAVSSISEKMCEKLRLKGVEADRISHFPNWVDVQGTPRLPRENAMRRELGIADDKIVALYSGNMGGKQGLEILAHAAALLRHDERLSFVFCGNGAGRADLVEQCQGLPNVKFVDLQPLEKLPLLLAMADIHLLPQRAGAADLVMPSKLTGMLASGRPVVATADEGTELHTVVTGCGLAVRPEKPRELAAAIKELADHPARREAAGEAARAYAAAHMDMQAVLSTFEQQLTDVVEQRRFEQGAPPLPRHARQHGAGGAHRPIPDRARMDLASANDDAMVINSQGDR